MASCLKTKENHAFSKTVKIMVKNEAFRFEYRGYKWAEQ